MNHSRDVTEQFTNAVYLYDIGLLCSRVENDTAFPQVFLKSTGSEMLHKDSTKNRNGSKGVVPRLT